MVQPEIIEVLKEEIVAMAATIERLEGASLQLKEGSSGTLAVIKAETIADLRTGKADLEKLLTMLQQAYETLQE
jgi:hypothetical protein